MKVEVTLSEDMSRTLLYFLSKRFGKRKSLSILLKFAAMQIMSEEAEKEVAEIANGIESPQLNYIQRYNQCESMGNFSPKEAFSCLSDDEKAECMKHIQSMHAVDAVKFIKEVTGLGLYESKLIYDQFK